MGLLLCVCICRVSMNATYCSVINYIIPFILHLLENHCALPVVKLKSVTAQERMKIQQGLIWNHKMNIKHSSDVKISILFLIF